MAFHKDFADKEREFYEDTLKAGVGCQRGRTGGRMRRLLPDKCIIVDFYDYRRGSSDYYGSANESLQHKWQQLDWIRSNATGMDDQFCDQP